MEEIKAQLETVGLADKLPHLRMTLFPLMALEVGNPDYLIMEQARDLNTYS